MNLQGTGAVELVVVIIRWNLFVLIHTYWWSIELNNTSKLAVEPFFSVYACHIGYY